MARSTKLAYKPVGASVSVVAGLIAGAIFKQAWRLVTHETDAPHATQRDRRWQEILAAAALEGAIFGLVKAALDRVGAKGFERATGSWPGDD
jgi:hypothetical protein